MLTPYDRKQQAAERAARAADALAELPAEQVPQSCNWDAELAALAPDTRDPNGPHVPNYVPPSWGGAL